jgi:DNA repair photolyase
MSSMADLQRAPGAPPPPLAASLPLAVERVRTFDTPEFAGMTFLEVEAKTALNRVRGMPFPWSLNPYRGCSHACRYCAAGETPILMADGRTKPLADVRAGDAIYGTIVRGDYRRYVVTHVLDHWSTVKPAYRTTLEDGTELITSGDHRFLTNRGWKHVTGTAKGHVDRANLTLNNKLIGTGGFATPPKHTEDYQRGYLRGMIRGDAHSGCDGRYRHFRLALLDDEGLQRTRDYLADHGVSAGELRSPAGIERIRGLIAWPADPSDGWRKGFLAGIFDAEGGYSRGILRLTNKDAVIIGQISSCLRRFRFAFVMESMSNGCKVVRVTGGLREHLRFFHMTDPAITRKRTIEGQALESTAPLRVVAIEPMGLDLSLYDITTGTGDFIADGVVSHNCFARPSHAYLNMSPLGDFERSIVVKTNVAEVLRRELARPTWRGEHVAMGTNTDNYQRAEGRYRLMPGIITALAEALTPFSILTKGTLITRDIPLLVAAAERVPVTAAFTIGMLDEGVWRDAEPGTPSPAARLAAVRKLNDAGIPTGIMLAPIMPGLNDDRAQLSALIDAAVRARATHITPIVLHLRPGVREIFWPWLTERHPELVDRYAALYRGSQAAKPYRDQVQAFVKAERAAAWARQQELAIQGTTLSTRRARHGASAALPQPRWRRPEEPSAGSADPSPGPAGDQLSLPDLWG